MIASIHRWLLDLRPAILSDLVKKLLRVKRVTTHAEGCLFCVDPVSRFGRSLLDTAAYEPELVSLMRRTLREGDVVVDVGASEGFFSVIASNLVGTGRVIAIEPQHRSVSVLEDNLRLNNCHNVHVVEAALAEEGGPVQITHGSTSNPGASGIYHRRLGATASIVAGRTLDDLLTELDEDRVRFLKIDAEGAELKVLQGGVRVLSRGSFDVVSVEVHHGIGPDPHSRYAEIDDLLRSGGYTKRDSEELLVYTHHGAEL